MPIYLFLSLFLSLFLRLSLSSRRQIVRSKYEKERVVFRNLEEN